MDLLFTVNPVLLNNLFLGMVNLNPQEIEVFLPKLNVPFIIEGVNSLKQLFCFPKKGSVMYIVRVNLHFY